jgi:hypothetical protein
MQQQKGTITVSHELEVIIHELEGGVGSYQSTVLSCVVGCCYQATASEDMEGLVFAVVICRVCRSVKVFVLIVL